MNPYYASATFSISSRFILLFMQIVLYMCMIFSLFCITSEYKL